jgi:hypothetical protein
MHAERCPVCRDVPEGGPKVEPDCPGCAGKGWVEVNDTAPTYVPYVVPYTPPVYPVYPPWTTPVWSQPNTSAPWPQLYYYTTCSGAHFI